MQSEMDVDVAADPVLSTADAEEGAGPCSVSVTTRHRPGRRRARRIRQRMSRATPAATAQSARPAAALCLAARSAVCLRSRAAAFCHCLRVGVPAPSAPAVCESLTSVPARLAVRMR